MRSRFAIIGVLAAALLALLYVAPVFAAVGWTSTNQGTADSDQQILSVGVLDPGVNAGVPYQVGTAVDDTDPDNILRTPINRFTFNNSSITGTNALEATSDLLKYTKVGNTVWVAAGPNTATSTPWGDGTAAQNVPYSLVYVIIDDETIADNVTTAEVAVSNVTSGQSVTAAYNPMVAGAQEPIKVNNGRLVLQQSGSGDLFHGYFFVVSKAGGLVGGHPYVVASDLDTIQVTGAGGLVRTLRVDATAPAVSGAVPLHNSVRTSAAATFSATITDSGSGLAPDVAGEDANAANLDGDGVSAEPRADANGASRDIDIKTGLCTADSLTSNSARAGTGWTTATNGYLVHLHAVVAARPRDGEGRGVLLAGGGIRPREQRADVGRELGDRQGRPLQSADRRVEPEDGGCVRGRRLRREGEEGQGRPQQHQAGVHG